MQLYYIITKYDTEQIRFQHTEVEKFSQSIAKGYDTYIAAKTALEEEYTKFAEGREVLQVKRNAHGTVTLAVFSEPEFREDKFGHRNRSTIEIFITKAVS